MELEKIRDWLSAPDPSTNREEALSQSLKGTGSWFIQSDRYTIWRLIPGQFFWLHGIPGSGKTVLISTILEDLLRRSKRDPTYTIAYYYFDFRDPRKQNSDNMLRSLITQLSRKCVTPPDKLMSLYRSRNIQTKPMTRELIKVLLDMIGNNEYLLLLLDALDECDDRKSTFEWLRMLMDECSSIHLLMTSRRERDIDRFMEKSVPKEKIIELEPTKINEDIRAYIRSRWSNDCDRWEAHPSVGTEIEETLMNNAKGM